jgi:hypothetical protein
MPVILGLYTLLRRQSYGLTKDSGADAFQVKSVSETRFLDRLGELTNTGPARRYPSAMGEAPQLASLTTFIFTMIGDMTMEMMETFWLVSGGVRNGESTKAISLCTISRYVTRTSKYSIAGTWTNWASSGLSQVISCFSL